MPQQRHLFIIDPLASLRWDLDTSLGLARALLSLGHEVWISECSKLSWLSGTPCVQAQVERLEFNGTEPRTRGKPELLSCAEFHAVHMRKDPPFDLAYITCTWLLDSLHGQSRVFNLPASLRTINEKLGIFLVPEHAHPTLVSANADELLSFIEGTCQGDAIIKPFDSFGGRGVERVNLRELGKEATLKRLKEQTAEGHTLRFVQRFSSEIFSGEVRAFAVGGKPLAWCLKLPAEGSYLANTRAGAQLSSYRPSSALEADITSIAGRLWRDYGIAFVGFDLIAGKLSEINVTSPRLLQGHDDTNDYFLPMAQWVSRQCRQLLSSKTRNS